MAQFKVKTVVFNGVWANIELEDGRKVSGNKEKEPKFGEIKDGDTIDGDIKEWSKDGKTSLFFNFTKAAGNGGSKFPPKDVAWEKRKASLECAIELIKHNTKEPVKDSVVLVLAETFHTYINQK